MLGGEGGAMARCSVDDMLDFLTDEHMHNFRAAADKKFILYEDLHEDNIPEGWTKEETWRLLTAIRKQAAVPLPGFYIKKADCWFVATAVLSLDAKALEVRCQRGSILDKTIVSLQGSTYLTRNIESTLARAFESEGVYVSAKRLHALFMEEAEPVSDIDKVAANFFRVSHDVESFAKREITPGLLETMYYELVEGVNVDRIPARVNAPRLDEELTPDNSWECMKYLCECAQSTDQGETRFGPILRLINVSWFFWNFDIFPKLNSLVGVLLRNLMAIKWGYPVLSWLPVGYYPFGNMNTPLMKSIFDNWSTDYGFGYDFTAYFTMYAKLYLLEVERLAEAVDYLQELNDLMEGAFDFPMNNRQKSILSSACRAPDSGMRIGPHQRTFRVAYATARADFLELERRGCLVRKQVGKAFVFEASDGLRAKIDSLGDELLAPKELEVSADEVDKVFARMVRPV